MAKLPAMQFYTGDWKKDPELSLCSPATRGVWVDLLCAMHDADRCGKVSGTMQQLARIGRCTEVEMRETIDELKRTKTATVTFCNDFVCVSNRRMVKAFRERKASADRQNRYRHKSRNGAVTQKSRSSSSSSSSTSVNTPPTPDPKNEVVQAWNSAPGTVPIRKLSSKRSQHLASRLAESDWDWPAALAKFPLKCFSDGDGWKPDFDWFVRPDTVMKILEGKYDWSKATTNGTAPEPPKQRVLTSEELKSWKP